MYVIFLKFPLESLGFPSGSAGKQSTCNAEDLGLTPGLGRSPGEGKGYSLQYSGLENSMACIVHGVEKSQTWLSEFHFFFIFLLAPTWKCPGREKALENTPTVVVLRVRSHRAIVVSTPATRTAPAALTTHLASLSSKHPRTESIRIAGNALGFWKCSPFISVCVRMCGGVLVAQLCPTLCDPIDYSPPGSSVHGILQSRIRECVAFSFSRESFRPRD